jgi:ribosome biogenesis SPOUT family RNA methylase Rps3
MDPLIRAEVVIGENTRQLLVEQNVTLTIPAIKVRNINAKVVDITTDVIADKVVIQGVLHKQIFFVAEDNIVHHQAEDIPFSTFVDVPGAEPGMNVQIDTVIETVIFSLLTSRIVHQKVVIEFFVKVTETRQLNVISGSGPLVRVDQVVGENTKQQLFENFIALSIPAIKVDDITVSIRDVTTHVIQDKVIIQGVIHKQIFFVSNDNIEFHQAEDIEFSTFVDIPGATPGMDVVVTPTVEFVHFELRSPTTVLQKVVVEFFAKVTESVQINLLLGPGALLKLETVVGENTNQILVENLFTLPITTVKIREIIAQIQNLTTEVINDKVIIQGILHKQIFFIGTDNLEHHQAEDIPFSTFVDIIGTTPGMNVRVDARIETILFELVDSTTLRQKVVIEFFVKVTETQQLSVQIVSPYYF